MRLGRPLRLLPLGFIAAVVFVTYGVIVWTLRRGFDWTDEAFVYNLVASNRETIGEPWGFQHLLHPLYVVTGQSVLAFRAVRLGGYVLLSVALVWNARLVMRRMGILIPRSGWVFILLLAQIGTFFAWSFPPQYLGYNELAGWFAQIGVALILLSLALGLTSPPGGEEPPGQGTSADRGAARALWSVWAGLGVVLTLLVFAKATSGLAFGAFLVLAVLAPNARLPFWKRAVAGISGAAGTLLVLWVCRIPIGFYFRNMHRLLSSKTERDAFGHPASGMVTTYLNSVVSTGRALLPALLIFALLAVTFLRKAKADGDGAWSVMIAALRWILGTALVIALTSLPRPGVWLHLGFLVTFIGAAGVVGLAILGAGRVTLMDRSLMSGSFSVAVGASAIVAAPFISAAGTSNPITVQFVFAATLWAVVLGIPLVLLAQRGTLIGRGAGSLPALLGCAVVLIAAGGVKDYVGAPYRTAPLQSQQTSSSVPELRGLLLTQSDASWIDWVSAAGVSLHADGVPATAIDSSGALFAFNHSGYANPWVGKKWPAAFRSLTRACTRRPADLFVLQPGTATAAAASTTGVVKSLATCGIRFPGDFRVVARRADAKPTLAMTIWRLKSG